VIEAENESAIQALENVTSQLARLQVWQLDSEQLRHAVGVVAQARTVLDGLLSGLTGAADAMGVPRADGASSATAWLSQTAGLPRAEAGMLASMARMGGVDLVREAWRTGRISTGKARVIMRAVDQLPEWVDDEPRRDAQEHLLRLAQEFGVDDVKRLANRVIEVIDPDGADQVIGEQLQAQERRAHDSASLVMVRAGDGTTRGSFTLPDADADVLRAAIEGIISPRRNKIAASQYGLAESEWEALARDRKMGHAFIELINHLPTEALPQAGGLAATVAVTVDVEALRTGIGHATSTSGTQVSAAKARRMACNARVVGMYLDSESKVLDLGTTRRLFDRNQRLALATRDAGCVWAGCDRPPAWCEAHHLDFWSEGGPTDLNNAALFCHFHHFLLHEGEWSARMAADGVVEVVPPERVDPGRRPRRHARFLTQEPRAA
jgi:hypothetical protein